VGLAEGLPLGLALGLAEGLALGLTDGLPLGLAEGDAEGLPRMVCENARLELYGRIVCSTYRTTV